MKIQLKEIRIKEVANGYKNNDEEGVVGYGGKLNIRPKYQREFVYKDDKRNAVIETINKDFPLNVMYWVKNEDGTLSVRTMDGDKTDEKTLSRDELLKMLAKDKNLKFVLDYIKTQSGGKRRSRKGSKKASKKRSKKSSRK